MPLEHQRRAVLHWSRAKFVVRLCQWLPYNHRWSPDQLYLAVEVAW